jgi:hypothetical protein
LRGIIKNEMGEKEEALSDLSKAGELGYKDAYPKIQEIQNRQ